MEKWSNKTEVSLTMDFGIGKSQQLLEKKKKKEIDLCGCIESVLFNLFSQLLNAADCFVCKVHMCCKCHD